MREREPPSPRSAIEAIGALAPLGSLGALDSSVAAEAPAARSLPGLALSDGAVAPFRPPRLLVSVRSADEAAEALAGGASIVDVKEPDRGPLGRAAADVQAAVSGRVRCAAPRTLVTAALGELAEAEDPELFEPPAGVSLFKLGLSGEGCRRGWEEALLRWAGRLAALSAGLVAVAYADHRAARSPEPRDVLRLAVEARLPFFLIDTFAKPGSLRGAISEDSLRSLIETAHLHGVRFALAGSLGPEDVEPLAALGPDVIAVRGAACREGLRQREVDRGRVERLARLVAGGARSTLARGPY